MTPREMLDIAEEFFPIKNMSKSFKGNHSISFNVVAYQDWCAHAYIHLGFVLSTHRRKGLYSQLYEAAKQWAIDKGATQMRGLVDTKNTPMIEACERMGRYQKGIMMCEDLKKEIPKVD